ncbi:erythromycin esterase family protein [Cupriavidus basilensis]
MFERRVNTWNLRDAHVGKPCLHPAPHPPWPRRPRRGMGTTPMSAMPGHRDAHARRMESRATGTPGSRRGEPLVGFTTHTGRVAAASAWDAEVEHKWVRPALSDSCEGALSRQRAGPLLPPAGCPWRSRIRAPLLQRAIGVIYLPESERASHYFAAAVADQFDAIFHVDETTAVEPLAPPWLARARKARTLA